MKHVRAQILEWAEQGALPPDNVRAALALTGVTPDPARWRRFVSALLLWLGVLLVAAGVIFFFAYNWEAMGRFAKFGLVEGLLAAAVIAAFIAGTERASGQAALLLASLFTGALLALIGQTYQTGADPYELFAWWALLILPWTMVARVPAQWLLFVLLLNLAAGLYFQASRGFFGLVFHMGSVVWALLAIDTAALAIWELARSRGLAWLQERWPVRLLAAASGVAVTTLALWGILEADEVGPLAIPAYIAWLGAAYFVYRHRIKDLFVLAGSVLSIVIVVATLIAHNTARHFEASAFLLIAVVVIVLSAIGAWWLKGIAAEEGE